jgi:peroxisomal 3,2-trans-enoyl-CoA isomerase
MKGGSSLKIFPRARGTTTLVFLARPKQKNAFTFGMYLELTETLRRLGKDPSVSSVVLTGEGDYYSSGNDLSNFSQLMHPRAMSKQAKGVCYAFVDAFVTFPKPLIGAVNGPAIGIAVTTLGLCDVRIAVPSATFHTPFKALGQAPEGCSSFMFPRLMGEAVARQVLDDGRRLTSSDALACGFVDQIVEKSPWTSVVDTALDLAQNPSLTRFVSNEKELLPTLQAVNQREVDVLEKAWVSPECFDALSVYLLSRKKNTAANVLRGLNATRWMWDR